MTEAMTAIPAATVETVCFDKNQFYQSFGKEQGRIQTNELRTIGNSDNVGFWEYVEPRQQTYN